MTYTSVTTNFANYWVIGDLVCIQLSAKGTTGGTTSTGIEFDLPIGSGTSIAANLNAAGVDSTSFIGRTDSISGSGLTGRLFKGDNSNWGLGTNRSIYVTGCYKSV